MGCDIHPFVEVNRHGRWEAVGGKAEVVDDFRDYRLFGYLAGVRMLPPGAPITRRRGLPDDLSPEVRGYMASDDDLECASWLTAEELLSYAWPDPEWPNWREGEGPKWVLDPLRALIEREQIPASAVRLVFAFDNV
jgi:hypothetical protein